MKQYPSSGLQLLGEIVGVTFRLRGWGMRHFEDRGIKKGRIQNLVSGKTDNPIPLLKELSKYIYRVSLDCRFEISAIDLTATYQDWVELERFAEIDRDSAIATLSQDTSFVNQPKNLKLVGENPLPIAAIQPVNSLVLAKKDGGIYMEELRGVGGLIKKILCQQAMTLEEFRSFTLFIEPASRDRFMAIVDGTTLPTDIECANLAYAMRRITGDRKYQQNYLFQIAEKNALIPRDQEHHDREHNLS